MARRHPLAMLSVLTNRQAALLFSGQSVSSLGDGVANIAFTLIVLGDFHSKRQAAFYLALLGGSRMLVLVGFLLFGGVLADRLNRRLVLLTSDFVRALVTGSFVVAALMHHFSYWLLFGGALVFGAFDAVFMPALTALTPQLLEGDDIQKFTALRPLANNLLGNMIGPALGGLLCAFSTTLAVGVDAASFLVSFSCMVFMRRTPAPPPRHQDATVFTEIKEGVTYVKRYPWIWTALASAALSNALVFIPVFTLLPWFIYHDLHLAHHAASIDVGWVLALGGLAGAIGNFVIGSRAMPRQRIRAMWLAWIGAGITPLLLLGPRSIVIVALVPVLMNPLLSYGGVIWETMLQTEVPTELLGRVSSLDWFVSLGIAPMGNVLGGVAAGVFGLPDYAAVACAIAVTPAIFVMMNKRVNAVDRARRDAAAPPPTPVPPAGGN